MVSPFITCVARLPPTPKRRAATKRAPATAIATCLFAAGVLPAGGRLTLILRRQSSGQRRDLLQRDIARAFIPGGLAYRLVGVPRLGDEVGREVARRESGLV